MPYRIEITGASGVARRMRTAAAALPEDVRAEQRNLGDKAELIFAAHALRGRTGRLARGIVAKDRGGTVQVEAHARNPTSGYDYVGVTRFGHKQARIYPKRLRGAATVLATGKARGRGNTAALAIPMGGGLIFRRSVKGFHPSQDWAAKALPQVEAEAQHSAKRLGERVAGRI